MRIIAADRRRFTRRGKADAATGRRPTRQRGNGRDAMGRKWQFRDEFPTSAAPAGSPPWNGTGNARALLGSAAPALRRF
jgi:hypothetical protein